MFAFVLTFVILQLMAVGLKMCQLSSSQYPRVTNHNRAEDVAGLILNSGFATWGLFLLF